MCGAPLVWCATHKAGPVAHIPGYATATYPWSTEMWCAVDNGPMDKGFPSSDIVVNHLNLSKYILRQIMLLCLYMKDLFSSP
jgi:hypothetical protein